MFAGALELEVENLLLKFCGNYLIVGKIDTRLVELGRGLKFGLLRIFERFLSYYFAGKQAGLPLVMARGQCIFLTDGSKLIG